MTMFPVCFPPSNRHSAVVQIASISAGSGNKHVRCISGTNVLLLVNRLCIANFMSDQLAVY